ncbi:MAG: hypothetical protein DRZ79_03740 [Candidatus Cloacimonadota bacterium]|nr:MAG: hypothetical protein DRZ79_03740 [Candidatus Cloacimonadota bacterium]
MEKIKVLLVEDDLVDQMAFKRLVKEEKLPYDYKIAGSASAAIKILQEEKFDIVITDYNLGDGTAFDIFDYIIDTPFIFITGGGDEELAVKALKAGAFHYQIKDQLRNYLKVLPSTIEKALKHKKTENEKKKAQEELRQNKERLDIILHSIGDGVIVINEKQEIMIINKKAQELLGFDGELTMSDNLHKALRNCRENGKVLIDAINQNEFSKLELEVDFPLPRVLSVTGTTFLDVDGKSAGKVFILRDVTKEKEIDRMKTDFVSSVSHELRTPLTSILGFSTTILKRRDIPEKTKYEFIEIIQKESKRLSRLIEDVLSISKIESGKITYDFRRISLKSIIEDVYEIYSPQAEKKKLKMILDVEENVPEIIGDRDALHQVVVNFVGNAIKFTPEGGTVTLGLRQENESVVLMIKDTGMGIPEKDQARIFDKFYRVYRPGTQIQGTGLGLSIVKEIIEKHKGRIELFSKVGKGTTFNIFFPKDADLGEEEQSKTELSN